MCGRYATTVDPGLLAVELDAIDETDPHEELLPQDAGPNYNVAPTTKVLTVVSRHDREHPDEEPRRRIRRMRWGLVPHWTKPAAPGVPAKGKPLFTPARQGGDHPSFRDALKSKRCLVPMDGWYEWLTEPGSDGKPQKTPFFMTPPTAAGLHGRAVVGVAWRRARTTAVVHDPDHRRGRRSRPHPRPDAADAPKFAWTDWLDPIIRPRRACSGRLRPISSRAWSCARVRRVNSVKNNAPDLLERVAPQVGEQISLL